MARTDISSHFLERLLEYKIELLSLWSIAILAGSHACSVHVVVVLVVVVLAEAQSERGG